MSATEHVRVNQGFWEGQSDEYQHKHGPQLSLTDPGWGVWQIPEAELQVLGDVRNRDVLELGCGGAQWSICLDRRGARTVGLDLSIKQLRHARILTAAAGATVVLVNASAEDLPFADGRFDIVFCDYGAMTFADPRRTVPEVARVLRSGGLFAFSHSSPLLDVCWPAAAEEVSERLQIDYFSLDRETSDSVTFQLPYGEWIRLFRNNGLLIEALLELQPPADATSTYRTPADLAWARRWPAEMIWKLHKEG